VLRRRYALVAVIAGLAAFTAWRFWHLAEKPITPTVSSSSAIDQSTSKAQLNAAIGGGDSYAQISLKSHTKEEAVNMWLERVEKDKKAEWKVPIQFYGKVIDENSEPVAGANVHFQWTDLSDKGTAVAETATDSSGRFSLDGVKGKRLSVRVTKEGYYASQTASYKSFEFSNPGENIYYEPDSANPVLFQLRRRGIGAQLIKRSVKVVLPGDGTNAKIDLTGGKIAVK
jgi:Carboxypeptidase regulatory-like domain